MVYCGAPLSVDPGIWPGIPHALQATGNVEDFTDLGLLYD